MFGHDFSIHILPMFGMIAVFAGVSIADIVPHFARGKKQEADEQNQKNGFGGYLHESKLRKIMGMG